MFGRLSDIERTLADARRAQVALLAAFGFLLLAVGVCVGLGIAVVITGPVDSSASVVTN
jgi:hypothetical protein